MENQNTQQPKKPMTASERLDAIELGFKMLDSGLADLFQNAEVIRQAIKLLDNKVNSMVNAVNNGEPLTEEVLERIMKDNFATELKQKVEDLKTKGELSDAEYIEADSFVVLKQIASEGGAVIDPRFQAPVSRLSEEVKSLLMGKKVGDLVSLTEAEQALVLEIYKIMTMQNAPVNPENAPDSTQETPVTEQTQA